MNKKLIKVLKSVKTSGKHVPEVCRTIKVDGGVVKVSNLHTSVTILEPSIPDGIYCKEAMEKGYLKPVEADDLDRPISLTEITGKTVAIDQSGMKKMITALKHIGKDELRPIMSGILLSEDNVVGTDAHSLYFDKMNCKVEGEIVLPEEFVKSLSIFDKGFQLTYNDKEVLAFDLKTFIHSYVIEGKYPNYNAVIRKESPLKYELNRKATIGLLKEMLLYANKTTRQIEFTFMPVTTKVIAEDYDFNQRLEKTIESKAFQNDCITIGFNGKLMMKTLESLEGENFQIELSEPSRAGIFDSKCLLMPVMLSR